MTEAKLTRDVKAWVKSKGGMFLKISDRFNSGYPDCWVCIDGVSGWVELKRPKGRRSLIQVWMIEQIRKAGGTAGFAESLEDVKNLLYKRANVC